ncbi:MAG: hypothetical protein M3Q34_04040, partial [bacterium]|nr:hypothetical protein [bacterium]
GRVSNVMLLTKERRKIHHISYDYCRLMLPIIPCGLAPGWLILPNRQKYLKTKNYSRPVDYF